MLSVGVVAAVILAACGSRAAQVRSDASTDTTGIPQTTIVEEPPYIAPTAAARAAIDAYALDTSGHDCVGGAADSGWPTTTAPRPSTCLQDNDRAGAKAFMIFTGRDGEGGRLLTSYRTEGTGHLSVLGLYAEPDGTVHAKHWTCTMPAAPVGFTIAFADPEHEVSPPLLGCQAADS
jgi:hypothetical protein